jgi:hypothetical protein
MNAICCPPLHSPDTGALGRFQILESSLTRLNARANADISLITADGDKVTLSGSSALRVTHTAYDYLGRLQDQAVVAHGGKFQISTNSEFTVAVQGELDQEELADIKKLFDAIQTTAADVFSGQSDKFPVSFAELDLDSIASFEAALSYSREASVEQKSSITSAGQAPTASATETTSTDKLSKSKSTDWFLKKLAQVARRLEGDEKNLAKLPRRFTQLFKKLAHNLTLDEHEQSLAERIAAEHSKRASDLDPPSTASD